MQNHNLFDVLRNIANQYPKDMMDEQIRDISRISFNIGVALDAAKPKHHSELELCDLGGGIGLFSAGCAAYGMKRTVLVDDFDNLVNHRVRASILDLHRSFGVEVIVCDVVGDGIRDIVGTFDIITTFDSMEHWHHSPKGFFTKLLKTQSGWSICPGCAKLREYEKAYYSPSRYRKVEWNARLV